MRRFSGVVFAMLVYVQSAGANAIDWFVRDWPPVNILQGPEQGQGAYDVMLNRLIAAMPQYQHQLHISTLTMRQQMMQQQRSHCLFGLLKTPQRQTFLQFSEPVALIPNLQVVALADHPMWQLVAGQQAIDPALLFQLPLRGMLEQNRTYPDFISDHLSAFVQVSATETNLVQMLKAKRADYVLEYPDRMHYLAKPDPTLKLKSMPLLGLAAVSEVYVACSMNEQAKAQIKAVNQAMLQLRKDPQYRAALLDWLTPQSRRLVQTAMEQSPLFGNVEAAVPADSTSAQ
jgi:uncharacterized protein (TIGR02285 family)